VSSSVAPGDFQENPIYAYFPGPPFRPKQHTVTHIHTHTQNNNENIEGSFGLSSITHGNFTLKCHHFQSLRAATVVDIQLDGCPDPSFLLDLQFNWESDGKDGLLAKAIAV